LDPRGASRFGGIPVSRPRTYANKIVAVRIGAPVFNGTDSSISRGSGYPAPPHESDIADFFRRAATADSKVLPPDVQNPCEGRRASAVRGILFRAPLTAARIDWPQRPTPSVRQPLGTPVDQHSEPISPIG